MLHCIQILMRSFLISALLTSVSYGSDVVTAPLSEQAKRSLDEVNAFLNSDGFREKVKRYENIVSDIRGGTAKLTDSEQIVHPDVPVLFISSSIPITALRSYAMQLDKFGGGVMVLRGLLGKSGMLQPTLAFINNVLNVDSSCSGPQCEKYNVQVLIDPLFFNYHGISKVPAFTVYEEKAFAERCSGNDSFEAAEIIYGDASVKGLVMELLTIDKRSTVKSFARKLGV